MGKRNRKVVSASLATALVASGSPYVASFAQDVQEAASQVPPNPVRHRKPKPSDPTAKRGIFLSDGSTHARNRERMAHRSGGQ